MLIKKRSKKYFERFFIFGYLLILKITQYVINDYKYDNGSKATKTHFFCSVTC